MEELGLECRDPPPLKLAMLERPASVAPSSTDTDPRGLTSVDGVALDTATSESSCESARSACAAPFISPVLSGIEKEILPGGALLGGVTSVNLLSVK